MSWIKNNIKTIIFWIFIIVTLFIGRFFYFWVVYPLILGILIFYSISFYKTKNYLVYPALTLGTLLTLFSFGEGYIMYITNTGPKFHYSVKSTLDNDEAIALFDEDPLLGYVARKGYTQVRTARYDIRNGSTIYDVINTTDNRGLRITPENEDTADTAIILFGCSYTFGEGLNDDETYAWYLAQDLGEQYQVYNYGVKGWGSNQTLALLESGKVDELKGKYKKVYGFYLTTPGIEQRSSGIVTWSKSGPWYVIDGNSVKYAGNFGDRPNSQIELRGKFAQSLLLNKLVSFTGDGLKKSQEEILDLDAAIIQKISEIFTEKFDNSSFAAVLYTDFKGLETRLRERDVNVLEVRPYFPENPINNPTYILHELDTHPNANATKIVSKALFDYIVF